MVHPVPALLRWAPRVHETTLVETCLCTSCLNGSPHRGARLDQGVSSTCCAPPDTLEGSPREQIPQADSCRQTMQHEWEQRCTSAVGSMSEQPGRRLRRVLHAGRREARGGMESGEPGTTHRRDAVGRVCDRKRQHLATICAKRRHSLAAAESSSVSTDFRPISLATRSMLKAHARWARSRSRPNPSGAGGIGFLTPKRARWTDSLRTASLAASHLDRNLLDLGLPPEWASFWTALLVELWGRLASRCLRIL